MIKILHTGDWHIGRFSNGPEVGGINGRFLDICRCLDKVVESAEVEKPDFIIVAGDMFHQARTWSDRGIQETETAIKYIRKLAEVATVVIVRGTPNHDGESHYEMLKTAFTGDDRVHIYTEAGVDLVYGANNTKKISVAALPGFDRGYFRAKNPGIDKEEENAVFAESLKNIIVGQKAICPEGVASVLVGHYTIIGCNMESGQTALFSQFEPTVDPVTLNTAGYDLVCFGHIHRPQQLEGCEDTFYSGAVSGLNFNDEGQERGFWYHVLGDDGKRQESWQVFTPSREFKTIRMTDEDVAKWNEESVHDPSEEMNKEVGGKIVRVIYDCTDEHNKAFNTAALAEWLKDCGAYFVQEVTPQKITVTVNREEYGADTSPEENLIEYLKEKDIPEDRIAEIVEQARPIIAEATETGSAEKKTGLFVPKEIEVRNYRNYREEYFNFDDIRFCTINGSNGVGKSSLFMDAMSDALFEETREGDLTGWICNDPKARSGSIKFTFGLGERTYRVTRTRTKSGAVTLNLAELVDGEWVDRSKEKARDTQQEIINTIGMDSLTLKACALIMQDQYGLFLQADKEARMNILGNILGLKMYEDMEENAAEKLTDTNRDIRTLTDKADGITGSLPDEAELEAKIEEKKAAIEAAEKAAEEKTAESESMRVKLNTQLEAAGRVIKLQGKETTLGATKASKIATETAQKAIVQQADAILAEEENILKGVELYKSLLEKEKAVIANKGNFDIVAADLQRAERTREQKRAEAKESRNRAAAMKLTKIAILNAKLDRVEELEKAHKEYGEALAEMQSMEAEEEKWNDLQRAAMEAQAALLKAKTEAKAEEERIGQRIALAKKKAELLEDSGCPMSENATCKFLKDALEAKNSLPELEAENAEIKAGNEERVRALEKAAEEAESNLAGSLFTQSAKNELRAKIRALEAMEKDYAGLEAAKNELETLRETVEELEGRATALEAEAAGADEEAKAAAEKLKECNFDEEEYKALKKEIADAGQWTIKERALPVAKEKKSTAEARVQELAAEIAEIEAELEETKREIEEEMFTLTGMEELKATVAGVDAEIKAIREEQRQNSMELGSLEAELKAAAEKKEAVKEITAQIETLGVVAAGYEWLKKAFSQDGIPHNIIRTIIPVFEATATNILGQMSHGRMSVELVTEKTLKSNSKKEVTALDIIINDVGTGRLPYMSRSGGERVKAALSVILALAEIKSTKAGVQVGFLFIDEAPFLDGEGTQAYCDALETIQSRYNNIKVMAITHDESFKARFPQSITVFKDEDGSHVRRD